MNFNYRNVPVTEPYARDLILEAHRLLIPHFQYGADLIFVEFWEMEAVALVAEINVVYYHPDSVKNMSLEQLCQIMREVLHSYTMLLLEAEAATTPVDITEHLAPEGTVFH
jgi:hypothetical protein